MENIVKKLRQLHEEAEAEASPASTEESPDVVSQAASTGASGEMAVQVKEEPAFKKLSLAMIKLMSSWLEVEKKTKMPDKYREANSAFAQAYDTWKTALAKDLL